ncbi:MAG: hypothetical protein A2075_08740 [Geobacteraceae bacterium GWC2_58_44]|nr:MAG: hypothetical protein A2075_08740 [Geobacteraceae bacterium GWC2_58_44]HBG06081.1 two-component system response regulator [Geobacter sp.]
MLTAKPVILCVDDDPSNLRLLERTLGASGYLVVKASDGRDALDIIGRRKIDVVLTDVLMPNVNGFEICQRIKGDERYRHIPVVMMTAFDSRTDRIHGIEAGADDFLRKPFDHGEVMARLRMLLRTKQLDEMLGDSYRNIRNLTSFGSHTMTSFHPSRFDLLSQIDSLAGQLIRKHADDAGRPSTILVRVFGVSSFEWCRYEYVSGKFKRSTCVVDVPPSDSENGVGCYNNPRSLPQFQRLIQALDTLGTEVANIVCYPSNMACIFALNYGREVTKYDATVLECLAMQTLFFAHLASQIRENEEALAYTVHSLARASEANDEDTGDHILRVGEYCAILAKELGLAEETVNTLRLQAVLHDVGKVHIPVRILRKAGALDTEEWEIMKRHTLIGAKIIGDHQKFRTARLIALSHHERWDGTGYPHGHSGESIPLEGRIMNMADQYDALRNARCYKPAFNHAKTVRILIEGDGRTMPDHFDPQVLRAFRETTSLFEAVYETSTT